MDAFTGCGGCTAKLGEDILSEVLGGLPRRADERLIVGYDSRDDAAVYRLRDDLAIIQTLDFFPPVTPDPYRFGRIAAANALSDVYAMGGNVLLALNIVAFDERKPTSLLSAMLQGGAEKVAEAGGLLAGGHTIHDPVPKYGLSVTGTAHPDKIWRNDTPREGDALLLTKGLGTGILGAANNMEAADPEAYEAALFSMELLNRYAAEILSSRSVHACTDVTGFGLMGHLLEMLGGAQGPWSADIYTEALPLLPRAKEYAGEFYITAAGQRNRKQAQDFMRAGSADFATLELIFDPQTSGGLLVSLPLAEATAALPLLRERYPLSAVIGRVMPRQDAAIRLI